MLGGADRSPRSSYPWRFGVDVCAPAILWNVRFLRIPPRRASLTSEQVNIFGFLRYVQLLHQVLQSTLPSWILRKVSISSVCSFLHSSGTDWRHARQNIIRQDVFRYVSTVLLLYMSSHSTVISSACADVGFLQLRGLIVLSRSPALPLVPPEYMLFYSSLPRHPTETPSS